MEKCKHGSTGICRQCDEEGWVSLSPPSAIFRVDENDADQYADSYTVLYREDRPADRSFVAGAIFETVGKRLEKGTRIRVTVEILK